MVGRLPFPDVTSSQELTAAGAQVRHDVPLSELTTLRVGGPARLVAECPTTEALVDVVRLLDSKRTAKLLLIGGGSNLLVGDDGFDGIAVLVADNGIEVGADYVVAQAGADWDEVVAATVEAGLGGLECLSGIPGSAGATPVQNVGAYGVEVASLLRRVQLLDRTTGAVDWVEPARLGFGYRTSAIKRGEPSVVLAVEFGLEPDGLSVPIRYRELTTALGATEGDRLPTAQVRAAVLKLRGGKGMVLDPADHDTWSAGSFFTNPVVGPDELPGVLAAIVGRLDVTDSTIPRYPAADGAVKLSAGWLIERAGFAKGYPGRDAPARLSTKHSLALTNRGSATASDIVELARTVRAGVETRFGVRLEQEPVSVGIAEVLAQ